MKTKKIDYSKHTVKELRQIISERGIDTGGAVLKNDLINCIVENDNKKPLLAKLSKPSRFLRFRRKVRREK